MTQQIENLMALADGYSISPTDAWREKFEAHWAHVRGTKKAKRELARHPLQPQTYVQDSANRHWVTWQAAQCAAPTAQTPNGGVK